MEFDKHDKVRSVLTEVIATFIREEANHTPLITVTNLVVSADYKTVRVLITTIPDGAEETALIFLKRQARELRTYIKKNARLKYIPHIDFDIDYGERHRQHFDEVLKGVSHKETL
jgi:ribosome-binding factor A